MIMNIKRFAITFFSILLLISPCVANGSVTIFGPKGFQRATGQPNVFQETFAATAGTGLLELFNGGPSNGSRVTSSWVVLNGKQILGPDDFEKGDALLQSPVTLEVQNTLEIRLASTPGSFVIARVTEASPYGEDTSGLIKADLAVTDLVITPDRCAPNTLVSIQATVTNWGRQTSAPTTLIFTVDGSEIERVAVNSLRVGASASFSMNWTAQGPGRHRVSARVEAGAGMFDQLLDNNTRLATLRVSGESPPVPELEFGPPQFHPPSQGSPATITMQVRNPSFADLSQIWLWLSVAGPSLAPQAPQNSAGDYLTPNQQLGAPNSDVICDVCPPLPAPDFIIASLPAGESTEVQFTWPYDTIGQYVVQVTAGNLPELLPMEERTAVWDLVVPGVLRIPSPIVPTLDASQPFWSSMGPYHLTGDYGSPTTGSIKALAVDPQDPNIIYAAGRAYNGELTGAGLWGTSDGGQTWYPLGDKFPHMNVSAIAVDPQNHNIVYSATGEWSTPAPGNQGSPPITGYILKSVDGGQKWYIFAHPADGYGKLVVRYTNSGQVVIYAASNRGMLRYKSNIPEELSSFDTEWHVILDGKIKDVVVHPTDPNVVFAVRYNVVNGDDILDGLYRTTTGLTATGNNNWSLRLGFTVPNPDRYMVVDLFRSNPQKVYLLTYDPQGGFQLRASEDQGGDFNPLYFFPTKCGRLDFLRVHPTVENLLYVGCQQPPGVNLLRVQAANGKWANWTIPNLHDDQHAMEFFPDSNSFSGWGYVLGNDGGVYRGKHLNFWGLLFDSVTPINNGLVSAELYDPGFDVSPTNPNVMIGGTQDNGTIIYQPNSNPYGKWKSVGGNDSWTVAIAPTDPNTIYTTSSANLQSMVRSLTGGPPWKNMKLTGFINVAWGSIFADPIYPKTIYVGGIDIGGGSQVQQSDDAGDNWTQIGPVDPQRKGDIVQVLMSSPVGFPAGILYAGTRKPGQIWARYLGFLGWFWTLVDEHPDPDAYVVRMALAPSNPNVLFVVYGNCTKDKRLRRLQLTPGSGWTGDWITDKGNLPEFHAPSNTPFLVNAIAVHPTDEHIVFVGTDKGVYQGIDLGQAWVWKPYNNFLPLGKISKLISIPLTGEIRAATYGRGVWTIKPYTVCTYCGG